MITEDKEDDKKYVKGGLCDIDYGSFRPNVGYLKINSAYLKNSRIKEYPWLITSVMHELIHILGFNKISFKFF